MQHKAHQPLLPCASKYLQYRWDKSGYEIHMKKLEKERLSKIQRENLMLLDKISHIKRNTGRTDCRNEYADKRLDSDKRQEALLEIAKDNKIMLRHLTQCAPYYSVQVWNEQWIKTLEIMKSVGRFPPLNHAQIVHPVAHDACLWTGGGNRSTQRKPPNHRENMQTPHRGGRGN
ncbi:uncharacterized protein cfap97d2 [Ictalurus punctatus]|uniref:Uncharacterized protein cfap97d2 n=1 Tax=Ictalurus punctatus TaxID=7998 RepID=A0A9F7TKH8_ICTPU|nr:uncharacterized protein cfap97d2 [Ictalurus punctatus]